MTTTAMINELQIARTELDMRYDAVILDTHTTLSQIGSSRSLIETVIDRLNEERRTMLQELDRRITRLQHIRRSK